ncbi:hypothetical protein CTAYLR_003335 [Chrysophaeum taylorii]|uniref:Gamma carbonic anhydrase n=1 Tax=Chrysophaeum taylorii TaxID=2483200 RepID=A0AAD7UH94_9STRA|nr:hypothetical protein CTAYLR_003335 [Chrysophaeum taylorii]
MMIRVVAGGIRSAASALSRLGTSMSPVPQQQALVASPAVYSGFVAPTASVSAAMGNSAVWYSASVTGEIGDNVSIGDGATVSGVIGNDVVIGPNAVVLGDVPAGSVVGAGAFFDGTLEPDIEPVYDAAKYKIEVSKSYETLLREDEDFEDARVRHPSYFQRTAGETPELVGGRIFNKDIS